MNDIRQWIRLVEGNTGLYEAYLYPNSGDVFYHGSKQPAIKQFEKRTGKRSGFFNVKDVMVNGFFFAPSMEEAKLYGPYVSAYHLTIRQPLVFGTDGVDSIADKRRLADLRYILAGALEPLADGSWEFQGMVSAVFVKAEDVANNDLPSYKDWVYEFLGPGGLDWEALDHPDVIHRMRERGYDSAVVYEKDQKPSYHSWFVLDASQIRFVQEVWPEDEVE